MLVLSKAVCFGQTKMGRPKGNSLGLTPAEIAKSFGDAQIAAAFPPILDMQQASLLLRRSPKTIYEWISKGRLDGALRRRGKGVLFYRDRLIVLIFNGPDWTEGNNENPN